MKTFTPESRVNSEPALDAMPDAPAHPTMIEVENLDFYYAQSRALHDVSMPGSA